VTATALLTGMKLELRFTRSRSKSLSRYGQYSTTWNKITHIKIRTAKHAQMKQPAYKASVGLYINSVVWSAASRHIIIGCSPHSEVKTFHSFTY